MAELAFQSEELDLEEWEVAAAHRQHCEIEAGLIGERPTAAGLIDSIRKNGPLPGYLESALILTLDEYKRVEEVHKDEKRKTRGWRRS